MAFRRRFGRGRRSFSRGFRRRGGAGRRRRSLRHRIGSRM